MIKTIIFDIGNVIVFTNHRKLYKDLAKNSSKSPFYIKRHYEKSPLAKDYERGDITPRQFYSRLKEGLDLNLSQREFNNVWCNLFSLNDEVVGLIKKLKNKYKLIIMSNTDPVHHQFIKKNYDVLKYFKGFVLSYQARKRKPYPLIYLDTLELAKSLPFECIFIDDKKANVRVGGLVGRKSIQYTNFKRLERELSKLGIL
jgi:glucose-1-phosphatase